MVMSLVVFIFIFYCSNISVMLSDIDFHDCYYMFLQMTINAYDPQLEMISFKRFCLIQC